MKSKGKGGAEVGSELESESASESVDVASDDAGSKRQLNSREAAQGVKFLFNKKPKEPEPVFLNKLKHLCRLMKRIAEKNIINY